MYLQLVLYSLLLCIKYHFCALAGRFIYWSQGPREFTPRSNFVPATVLEKSSTSFKLLTKCSTFVDKTKMIENLFTSDKRHHIILYPRRFGKSTNLDMIKYFTQLPFEPLTGEVKNIAESENFKLFNDPKFFISKRKTILENHLGRYPVIKITFGEMRFRTLDELFDHIRMSLVVCYLEYVWIYHDLELQYRSETNTRKRCRLIKRYDLLDRVYQHNITEAEIPRALRLLCKVIKEVYSKEVILLVDDFDAPVINAVTMNLDVKRVYDLMDEMFYNVLKNKTCFLAYSILTGTSHMALATSSSKLNRDFAFHHFLDNHLFAEDYGFSEQEVTELFDRHYITDEERLDVKRRFFGYTTRRNKLQFYNTFAIVQFFAERSLQPLASDEVLADYWTETGSISNIHNILKISDIRNLVTRFLCRDRIKLSLNSDVTIKQLQELQQIAHGDYGIITNDHIGLFFAYFFEQGYLNYANRRNHYQIPNYEIKQYLKRELLSYYNKEFPRMKTNFIGNLTSIILHLEFSSTSQLIDLETSFNQLFNLIGDQNLPSYQYTPNQWEFISLLYWVSSKSKYNFHDLDIGVEVKSIQNGTEAFAHLMFWSQGQRLILLAQVVLHQDFIVALDQIQGYVPKYHKSDVVKYLGININENYTIEIGDGTNHGTLKFKPGEIGYNYTVGYYNI